MGALTCHIPSLPHLRHRAEEVTHEAADEEADDDSRVREAESLQLARDLEVVRVVGEKRQGGDAAHEPA